MRDRYHRRWYRGKVLLRLGRRQDPAYKAQVYAAARALIADCFPPRLDVKGRVRIDPEHAAGGAALPPGRYDVLVTLSIAGFAAETSARADGTQLTVTVSPDRRIMPSELLGDAAPARRGLRARIARALRGHTRWW